MEHLRRLAAACADEVTVPFEAGCCGFAGDRGLLHPELTASATAREAAEVNGVHYDDHLSSNRTCELGLTRATGRRYRHAIELLEELTRGAAL
ncbi:MAG: oxidoreductase [Micropruina sp.]|nr:oxidoreductase [Micropruina sp.]